MNDMKDIYEHVEDAEDRAIERYIERRRKEYEKEWRQYLSEDKTREEINYILSTLF